MDLVANLKAAHAAVHAALDVYGVSVKENVRPVLSEHLQETQKAEIIADCYQLLLILAETEAQSASDQKSPEQTERLREALRLLDQSLRFGAPSRAYHLRRARYLSRLDEDAAAAEAEQAAEAAPVTDVLDHFLMADEFYRRAKFDEAIEEFGQDRGGDLCGEAEHGGFAGVRWLDAAFDELCADVLGGQVSAG